MEASDSPRHRQLALNFEALMSVAARSLPPAYPVTPTPGRISFSYGLCAPESFVPEVLAECARTVLSEEPVKALQYGPSQGSPRLIRSLANFLQTRGMPVDGSTLIITTGSMQALELAAQLLVDPGDAVIVEAPTFMGALEIFRKVRARICSVPLDGSGLDPHVLANAVKKLHDEGSVPKLLYTIPTFQNPSGLTTSLDRRKAILAVARDHNLPIVEDDAYREIWFWNTPPPSYFSLDPNWTIYLGTFSKLLAPGLRIGWLAAAPEIVPRILALKRDAGSSPFVADLVATFMARHDFEAHLGKLRDIYRRRSELAHHSAERHLQDRARWQQPAGGFFLWVEVPGVSDRKLLQAMARHGVEAIPGYQCFADWSETPYLRIAYSSIPTDEIDPGMERLAKALEACQG